MVWKITVHQLGKLLLYSRWAKNTLEVAGHRAFNLELLCPGVTDGIVAELPEKMIGLGPDYLRLPFTARDTLRAKGWICGDDLLAMVMQRMATLEKQV